MSTALATTTTASPLMSVLNTYLDTIQTKSGATPDQKVKENFISTCIAYELNPIKRQAYLTGYDSKAGATFTFIIGIDGFASIASRSKEYAGKDQARFTYQNEKLDSAVVTVYRLLSGQKCSFTGQAFYDESVQTTTDWNTKQVIPNSMWSKMPRTMLEKCAFAKALRSAFPESLSGMYTDDEIAQEPTQKPELDSFLAQNIERKFEDLAKLTGKTTDFISDFWLNTFSVIQVLDLSENQAKNLNKKLDKEIQSRQPQTPAQEVVDVQTVESVEPKTDLVTEAQLKRLFTMWGEIKTLDPKFDVEFQKTYIAETYNIDSTKELTKAQYTEISNGYEELLSGLKNQTSLDIQGTKETTQI